MAFNCFPVISLQRKRLHVPLIFLLVVHTHYAASLETSQPVEIELALQDLLNAYPDHLEKASDNIIYWKDGSKMVYDDGRRDKTFEELLNEADLQDQMSMIYPAGKKIASAPEEKFDPGRIRYEPFFRKMYGDTKEEVEEVLVAIDWLPSITDVRISVTTVNDVHLKLNNVSKELEKLPENLHKYVKNIGGTFMWRNIAGTNRLSTHSFGIAIDINVELSNYWRSSEPDRSGKYVYKNRIPLEIVKIFEKHGFIWGGRWYHFDTMHFEYRPELLINTHESSP